MGRLERRLLRLTDDITKLRRRRDLVAEELRFHEHLDDDARRDAAVSDHPLDRADARDTAADVARFRRSLADLEHRVGKLESKRDALLQKLD
jgi:ubiquinone biosynthesis protein UbiJ